MRSQVDDVVFFWRRPCATSAIKPTANKCVWPAYHKNRRCEPIILTRTWRVFKPYLPVSRGSVQLPVWPFWVEKSWDETWTCCSFWRSHHRSNVPTPEPSPDEVLVDVKWIFWILLCLSWYHLSACLTASVFIWRCQQMRRLELLRYPTSPRQIPRPATLPIRSWLRVLRRDFCGKSDPYRLQVHSWPNASLWL